MQPNELERLKTNEPYRYWFASRLAPSRVVRSYPFIIVWLLLFNSTLVCTYRRVKGQLKLNKLSKNKNIKPQNLLKFDDEDNAITEKIPIKAKSDIPQLVNQIKAILKKYRWKVTSSQNQKSNFYLEGKKGGVGFWGSILFHIGLLLLFVGAGISSLTKYNASILITENYALPLQDTIIKVAQKPLIFPDIPGAIISLKSIDTRYGSAGQLTDFAADVSIASFNGVSKREKVRVNQPLDFLGLRILPEKYGISPLFFLTKKGKVVDRFNINLGDWLPRGWTEKGTFDSFLLGNTNYRIKVQFIPNLFINKKGKVISKGTVVKNPAMILTVLNDKNGKEIKKKLVKKNESIKFAGQELIFKDLNYWGYFKVVRDYGVSVILFSMIAGLIGLAVRYVYHDKNIWIIIRPQAKENYLEFKIGGKSKYFPALFKEELKKLGEQIKLEGVR